MIRNSETTRLEMVSTVRRLFLRMFLKINLANFIAVHPFQDWRSDLQLWLVLCAGTFTLVTYDTFNYSGTQAEKVPAQWLVEREAVKSTSRNQLGQGQYHLAVLTLSNPCTN
jgi:hypothetical protein